MGIENKRNDYTDFLKGIGIFLVILGHHNDPFTGWTGWIYSFHMPFFFILSGVFHNNGKNYYEFVKKKAKGLLIPYYTFATILFMFWLGIGRKFGQAAINKTPIKECLIGIFYGTHVKGFSSLEWEMPLWFLLCLFVVSNMFYFLSKLSIKKVIFIEICFVIIAKISRDYIPIELPWSFQRALVDVSFYSLGYYGRDFIKDENGKKYSLLKGMFFILLNILIYLNDDKFNILGKYNFYTVYLIGGLFGSLGIIEIFKNIKTNKKINKKIEYLGRNSLILLAFHSKAMTFIKFVFMFILHKTMIEGNLLIDFIYSILQVIVCIPIIKIINKYFYFVLGKKRVKIDDLEKI